MGPASTCALALGDALALAPAFAEAFAEAFGEADALAATFGFGPALGAPEAADAIAEGAERALAEGETVG